MEWLVRDREPKGGDTEMPHLPPPRQSSTLPARLLTIPSCGVRFRTQRTCYRVCCISVGAARCQPEKNASPGGQRIYATQEIAHGVAKGGLIVPIQCVQ